MFIFVEVEATEAGSKMAVFFPFKGSKGWRVQSVCTLGEFWVPEIHGGTLRDFSEGRVFRRWWHARSSVCARKAGENIQVCSCIGRVSMNVRAYGGRVAEEGGCESRSPIFKFKKSSLKTSAIAFHAVVFGVHEAPCRTDRSSKGHLQQQRFM